MKFVEVEHKLLGTTTVPESRVAHLASNGWKPTAPAKPKRSDKPPSDTPAGDAGDTNKENT